MYKIKFFNRNGHRYDFCEFGLLPGEEFMDKLAEVLYIMQDLTPQHRDWKIDLATTGICMFISAGNEIVTVEYDWRGSPIEVRDR